LVSVTLVIHTFAGASQNRYSDIASKNIYRLRTAPVAKTNEPPFELLPKVTLTGVTDILGEKMALLEVQPPGKTKISLVLCSGQADGEITLLSINQGLAEVTIRNRDTTQTLDMSEANDRMVTEQPMVKSNPNQPDPQGPAMSPEEQVVQMEINRELTKRDVETGKLPPLPPTPPTILSMKP